MREHAGSCFDTLEPRPAPLRKKDRGDDGMASRMREHAGSCFDTLEPSGLRRSAKGSWRRWNGEPHA